jgi:hypothetical protein
MLEVASQAFAQADNRAADQRSAPPAVMRPDPHHSDSDINSIGWTLFALNASRLRLLREIMRCLALFHPET